MLLADGPPLGVDEVATWSAFVIGILTLVFLLLSKSLGGVTDTRRLWRDMRKASEDARVADLTEDITYLRRRVDYLIRESDRMWALIHKHRPWDHQAIEALRDLDPDYDIPPPPPLMPYTDIAREAGTAIAAAEARSAIDTIEAKASNGTTPAHGLRLEHLRRRRPPEGT